MTMYEAAAEHEPERALLVGLVLPGSSDQEVKDTLDELGLLADTAGAVEIGRVTQERERIDPTYFIGRGKAEEVSELAKEAGADVAIFDDDLSPAQTRNLEQIVGTKIIDRSRLILDIFAFRAQSREAQTQVELAQLEYMLPRLTRQWTHLSRQAGHGGTTGGIGTRGPGETQLEVDRRAVRNRIGSLKQALSRISRRRAVGRKRRVDAFSVALVGYTNAGKSTLMRALSGADVLVEDQLFATLDSTTRRVSLGHNREMLLTDTVGFVRKLPHHLVASFRSTFEETVESDLLLHVVDGSHPACQAHVATVLNVLEELGIVETPALMVLNKADRLDDPGARAYLKAEYPESLWISAQTGEGLENLRRVIYDRVEKERVTLDLQIPQAEGGLISELHRVGEILDTRYEGNDVLLRVKLSSQNAVRLLPNGRYRYAS